jgi:glutathione S-transferase
MICLHHLEKSRSLRILWALEELQLEYEVKFYHRLTNFSAPPELKNVHPLGKAPVLTDQGFTIAESAAILEYLQEKYDQHSQFKPKDHAQKLQYRYWMHYAEGSLMPLLLMTFVMNEVPKKLPEVVQNVADKVLEGIKHHFISPRLKEHLEYLEDYLTQNEYFTEAFSFADIQMSFALQALAARFGDEYANIQAYVKRIEAREAYQRAKAKDQQLNQHA